MDSKIAKAIAPLVNKVKDFNMLKEYAEYRIEHNKNLLVNAKTFDEVIKYQAAIAEMKRILTLQDEVKSTIEDNKYG